MTHIKITEHIGPAEVNAFAGGFIKITREGSANEDTDLHRNVVVQPRINAHALMYIGTTNTSSLLDNPIRVSSDSLRWLARFFESAADHMNRDLVVPPEAPVYKPVLLIEDDNGDWFYTGDLTAAKRLVALDREAVVKVNGPERYHVDLIDDPDNGDSVAEWGGGRTEEEAWRYALGSYFGPADDGYDEHRLLRALACGDWSSEPPVLPPAKEITATPRLTVGENGEPVVSLGPIPYAAEHGLVLNMDEVMLLPDDDSI